ncbi:hypothetical protein PLEOSDRAFT_164087 [Pleurotus ostreatus PC15]|uniref:Uncharacterized protein n=1 Tax=Pleurotus ostreatus (strain PC15) TaxID=1137138 RepID=A0A067PC24_PLEO1|nr:hypothetical protein PLEOSDRAFT_164087 [Pleurotus ostreatus PC15]
MAIHGSSREAHRTNFEILGVFPRDFGGRMSYQRKGRRTPEEGKVVAGNSTRLPGQFSTELAVGIHLSASVGTRVEIGSGRKKQIWHLVVGGKMLGDRHKETIAEVGSWGVHRQIHEFLAFSGAARSKADEIGHGRKAPGVKLMVSYGLCRGHESPDSEAWGGMPAANEDTLLMQDDAKRTLHPVAHPQGTSVCCNTDSRKAMGHTTGSLTALLHMYHPPECSISGIHFNLNHGHLLLLVPISLHPIQIARSPSFSVVKYRLVGSLSVSRKAQHSSFFAKLPSVLMPDTLKNAVPDNSAPVSYITRVVLAEIDPSPTWVVISSLLLLSISPFTLNSSNYVLLLSTPVRLGVDFCAFRLSVLYSCMAPPWKVESMAITTKTSLFVEDHCRSSNTEHWHEYTPSYVFEFDSHFSPVTNSCRTNGQVRKLTPPATLGISVSATSARMWDHENQAHLRRQLRWYLNPDLRGIIPQQTLLAVRGPSTGMMKPSVAIGFIVSWINMPAKLNGDDRWTWCDWGTWLAATSPTSALNRSLVVCDGRLVNQARHRWVHTVSSMCHTTIPGFIEILPMTPLRSPMARLQLDAVTATQNEPGESLVPARQRVDSHLRGRQWALGLPDWLLLADGHDRRRLEMLLRGQWVAHDIWVADYRAISRTTMGAQSQKG